MVYTHHIHGGDRMMHKDPDDPRRADRQFRDKAADLLRSDSHDFDHNLKVFVRFVLEDSIVSEVCRAYLDRDVDLQEWIGKLGWRSGLILPLDDDERTAMILQLLVAISEGRADVLRVADAVSYERKYDDLIRNFNDKFTRIAVRDIGEVLRGMIPPQNTSATTVINAGPGSTNMVAVGNAIEQSMTVTNGDLAEVITAMRDVIMLQDELSPGQRSDLSDDLDILEREGRRSVPRTEILLTVIQSLAAVPGLFDLVSRVAQLLNINI